MVTSCMGTAVACGPVVNAKMHMIAIAKSCQGDNDGGVRPVLQAHEAASGGDCTRSGKRWAASALVPDDVPVGAVRISANGWEAAVLAGLEVRACWVPIIPPANPLCVMSFWWPCLMIGLSKQIAAHTTQLGPCTRASVALHNEFSGFRSHETRRRMRCRS